MLIYHKKNPDTLMMAGFFYGRRTDTQIEPILQALYDLLRNSRLIKDRLRNLKALNESLIKTEKLEGMKFLF